MSRWKIIMLAAMSLVLALAIAWDIIDEIPEKGALRSAGRGMLLILMPAFLMTRALWNEWRTNRQQIDGEGLGSAGAPPSPSS